MEANDNIDEELKGIAPLLSGLPKKGNFSVPENYFEEFPERMRNRIGYSQARQSAWANVQQYLVPQYSPWLATLAFLVLVCTFALWRANTIHLQPVTAVALRPITTQEYVLEHVDEDMLINEIATDTKYRDINKEAKENLILDNIDESTITEDL